MKNITFLLLIQLGSLGLFSQDLTTYDNGLIYQESTVNRLRVIVDSLDLKYRACEPKQFYGLNQAKGYYVIFSGSNDSIDALTKKLEANAVYEQVISEYTSRLESTQLEAYFVKRKNERYDKTQYVEIEAFSLMKDYPPSLELPDTLGNYEKTKVGGTWQWSKRNHYSDSTKSRLTAIYFTSDFAKTPLPETYNQMVLYSECMVDTQTQIYLTEQRDLFDSPESQPATHYQEWIAYVNRTFKKQLGKEPKKWKARMGWNKKRNQLVLNRVNRDKKLQRLLDAAIAEAVKNGGTHSGFESLISQYSKKDALAIKRQRIVVGMCSQDQSPRIHAQQIAMLAAETANWEVFLRAHLDIMNDNFSRASDGSYAWKERKTYLREIESLDLNAIDLLLGISMRVENPSSNHYYSSISRTGRALAETQDITQFQSTILDMLFHPELDEFNRYLIYWLYLNYLNHQVDETFRDERLAQLKSTANQLPAHLANHLEEFSFSRN